MNDSRLKDLFKDFRSKYPKMDYFTQEEIFQYMRISFHLGYDLKNDRLKLNSRKVVRSDGIEYKSLTDAAKNNNGLKQNIRRSIVKGYKCGGYNWSYV